ncbi:MAG TPA: hypothetical protein PK941_11695, partial [Paludibacter sp.]|nr:hypothetical protein [Paludibacter sp.]
YYLKIAPWNYVTGRESRGDFVSRHSFSYPVMKYINESTPKNSRVRLLFLGRRGYYLDRTYEADWNMGMNFIRSFITISSDPDAFQKRLESLSHTHWLIRKDLFNKFLLDNYSPDVINIFFQRTSECLELIYDKNGYAVYRIRQIH